MKNIFLILTFLFAFETVFADYRPSESTKISVLVCSPGDIIYTQFGHAAIRVCDTANKVDAVFDYGVFSIGNLLEFVGNFMTGNMDYLLATRSFRSTYREYDSEKRGITEYVLNITQEEKEKICEYLLWNLEPQNRVYLYNFFEDNCATRIYDLLNKQIPELQWNEEFETTTWRKLTFQYANPKSWTGFGIDLGIGYPADTVMSSQKMMFIPELLGKGIETATVGNKSLCLEKNEILQPEKKTSLPLHENATLQLWIAAFILFFVTIWEIRTKKRYICCDVLFLLFAGFFGGFIWFISFASIHSIVFPNFNTLWLTPFHIVFAIIWLVPKWRNYTKYYFIFSASMVILYFFTTLIAGQTIAVSSWPIMLIFILRAIGFTPLNKVLFK
ncbi:MAG: DUF4105 domain-containing protein [Bacteroidales bacterium]|nr:DUF4105 domain-containing protein [Bacteroidales bacterium]